MRVLLTGHQGAIGRHLTEHLSKAGHEVIGFDIAAGQDVRDLKAVREATKGCDAVVHLAAIAHDTAGTPDQIMSVNLLGSWHVLQAAEEQGLSKVIHFSSGQVFGTADGERLPDYYPVDDAHPRRAMRPYGVSKKLSEDMCEAWSRRTGIPSISLRPVAVWDDEQKRAAEQRWRNDPDKEAVPFWENGGWVHVHDIAVATELSLTADLNGHTRALLCSDRISGSAPSLELAAKYAPTVPVRDREPYERRPDRALVDCSVAKALLGWQPQY